MNERTICGLALAFAGACLLPACTPVVTGASARSAEVNPITSGPQIGRCYSGGCSWFDIRSFNVVRETSDGALIRIAMREGGSESGEGPHPESSRGVDIKWDEETSNQYVFCSRRLPAIISQAEEGSYEARRLDLVEWSVPTEFITNVYAHVCHSGDNILAEGATARAGYRAVAGEEQVIALSTPEAIFQHIGD